MSRLTRGPPFSGAAVAFMGRRMATLLLLAFEVCAHQGRTPTPRSEHELCGGLEMGENEREVNVARRSMWRTNWPCEAQSRQFPASGRLVAFRSPARERSW